MNSIQSPRTNPKRSVIKGKKKRKRLSRRAVILIMTVSVVVCAVAVVGIYREFVSPFNTTVLIVDGTSFRMRYFLKRLATTQQTPVTMLHTLAEEQIVKEVATKPPYDLTVTEQEVSQYAHRLAAGAGEKKISEARFKVWYRQELNQTRLSRAQFTDLLRTRLLIVKMGLYLTSKIPKEARQVFVNAIPVDSASVGKTVERRCNSGASFTRLARQYSTDPRVIQNGGKVGWFPRGVLSPTLDSVAFTLPLNRCSNPISVKSGGFVVLMVSKTAAQKPVDAQARSVLSAHAFSAWYAAESPKHTVTYHGFNNGGYDSETNAWVQLQVRMMRSRDSSK